MSARSRVGTSYEGYFPVLGSRIPLRPGSWKVLAELRGDKPEVTSADCFLGRINGGILQEAMRIWAAINTGDGENFNIRRFQDNDLYRFIESKEKGTTYSAWVIQNCITPHWRSFHDRTTGITDLEMSAAETMARDRIGFPPEFLRAQFVRKETAKALQVTYYLNPASAGLAPTSRNLRSWSESDFAPLRIRADPQRFAFFQNVVSWSEGWWPKIKLCFSDFYLESSDRDVRSGIVLH